MKKNSRNEKITYKNEAHLKLGEMRVDVYFSSQILVLN